RVGLAPLVPEDFKFLTESTICERGKEAKAWMGAGKGEEPKQSGCFKVSFSTLLLVTYLTVRPFPGTMAHVVRLILAGQLLIDSK
ncbi:MAG: hypothetical protein WA672_00460, partial [Candidatus Angelobacter sp.]